MAVLAAAIAAPRVARADGADSVTARLEWSVEPGSGCVDSAGLEAAVNERWNRSVFVESGRADLVLEGRIARGHRGFVAELELKREGGASLGSRTLQTRSANCRVLDDSVALAAGLMLDVSRAMVAEERRAGIGEARPTTESAATGEPPPSSVAAASPGRTPASGASPDLFTGPPILVPDPPATPWSFEPWVAGEVAFGLLPPVAFGGRAGISIAPPGFARVEIAGSWFLPLDQRADAERGVHLSALAADIGLCVDEWESPAFRLHGCFTERIGRVRAAGFGLSEPATASELLFDVGLRQVGTLRLTGSWGLRVGASLEVPLVRYRFVFDDVDRQRQVAYEMNRVSAAMEVGVTLRLP